MELTPKNMQCMIGGCPAIYEITPKNMACSGLACPSIYEEQFAAIGCPSIEEHEGRYLIVGKREDVKEFGLEKKVGEGEILISVPKELIDNMKK